MKTHVGSNRSFFSGTVVLLLLACLLFAAQSTLGADGVKAREVTITLPTYLVAPADLNPRFYSGRTYQGAKATFYPYPVSDQMTERREPRPYKSLELENRYIQFSVLPELGGRIFTALDKGNDYDFFYRQHVIKPALIGMLGAWISGGVEWNVPHHHRASSFMTVDHAIEEQPDGSKTIWVGETELRHRLRWIIGMTLRPDRSYIEMTVRIFNRTPAAQSFLFWINPAVHANETYQVIFPPSTQWAVQHGKPEFAGWPVARQVYGGTDYTRGVDISWWKNHPSPVSFFAWHCEEDFFGGYDHGKQAGVIQVSNHHVSPGKKFFEWGNGPEGEMWTKILSDEDGPYLELMAGSFSDNQPDYSWCQPGEVKEFKHYWYPVRELGGVKNANTEAAVNLDVTNNRARVAFNATKDYPQAKAALRAGQTVIAEKRVRIGPDVPCVMEAALPAGVKPESLRASLSVGDRELIAYQSAPLPDSPKPAPAKRPIAPKDVPSNEELYLTGLRIEQLYSPSFDPVPYYQEALRRDAGDYRVNVALAGLYCRQGRFPEAEPLLRAATARATTNYIRPKDSEAHYYLGVTLRAQGKRAAARDEFYRAVWGQGWQAPGYLALAELACADARFAEALELCERSLLGSGDNTKALELKSALLRHLGRSADAAQLASRILELDPLNPRARFERVLLVQAKRKRAKQELEELIKALRGEPNSYLELSVDYANAGLLEEATQCLETYLDQAPDKSHVYPLAHYYLAFFADQSGNREQALAHLREAARMPSDYCFPFQFEAEPVLLRAMELNPQDARAHYYLGNLLFDNQPTRALALWAKAAELEPSFALAHRNLGFGRAQAEKDLAGAIPCLERAVALAPDNSRLYYELDVLYEAAGTPLDKRLALMNRRVDVVSQRDDAITRRVMLLTAAGDFDAALKILREHHFHNWEGSSALHDVYVDACLSSGLAQLRAGRAERALADFRAGLEYPANQEVGKPKRERRVAQTHYVIGLALDKLGKATEAETEFARAAAVDENNPSEAQYYKGLALAKTGKNAEAEKIFGGLIRHGEEELKREVEEVDYFAKFGERRAERLRQAQGHYLAGLGCLGLNKPDEAKERFSKALELNPTHLGALTWK